METPTLFASVIIHVIGSQIDLDVVKLVEALQITAVTP
jgi:hypothetical protein